MKYFKRAGAVAAFAVLLGGCGTPSHISFGVHYSNPGWAPPYYDGVRYYYLPDIEVYYDLSGQEFIYLDNGNWLFSPALPPIYSGYDLFNGFVIAFSWNVFQPWMHHQYYISHYPRYYYHNIYRSNISTIRGFNENDRNPIYWRQEDRNRINDLRKIERPERKVEAPKQPQPPNYYGKKIGQPVKVKPKMKEKTKVVRPKR